MGSRPRAVACAWCLVLAVALAACGHAQDDRLAELRAELTSEAFGPRGAAWMRLRDMALTPAEVEALAAFARRELFALAGGRQANEALAGVLDDLAENGQLTPEPIRRLLRDELPPRYAWDASRAAWDQRSAGPLRSILREHLEGRDVDRRVAAVWLCTRGSLPAVAVDDALRRAALTLGVTDPSPRVRGVALAGLSALGEARERLQATLALSLVDDPDPWIARNAIRLLSLGGSDALPIEGRAAYRDAVDGLASRDDAEDVVIAAQALFRLAGRGVDVWRRLAQLLPRVEPPGRELVAVTAQLATRPVPAPVVEVLRGWVTEGGEARAEAARALAWARDPWVLRRLVDEPVAYWGGEDAQEDVLRTVAASFGRALPDDVRAPLLARASWPRGVVLVACCAPPAVGVAYLPADVDPDRVEWPDRAAVDMLRAERALARGDGDALAAALQDLAGAWDDCQYGAAVLDALERALAHVTAPAAREEIAWRLAFALEHADGDDGGEARALALLRTLRR